MRSVFFFSALAVIFLSCSSEPKVVHLRTVKGQKKEVAKVNANKMLSVEIEGMSCEMACGGSIRMNLKATGAVDRVKFDFVDGRKIQTAFISYDDSKISERQMLKLIESINENQFRTHKHTSEEISSTSNAPAATNGSGEENSKIDVSDVSPSIELPNLFDLLKNLVR